MKNKNIWRLIASIEFIVSAGIILYDFFIPTLIILAITILSLLLRKEKFSSLGFKKNNNPLRMATTILLLTIIWTLFHLSITMPLLNMLTGTQQDLSMFQNLKGNLGDLLFFLTATWTLAALGEEIVYRGFLQSRIGNIFGKNRTSTILAIIISSLLFGLAHLEQGIIGVVITIMDAIFFSYVKLKFDSNLWAAVLAHGLSNSIGLIGFYFLGPIYGLW